MSYTGEVVEILPNGDAVLELPSELLQELGWQEGDELDISLDEQNRVVLKKVI